MKWFNTIEEAGQYFFGDKRKDLDAKIRVLEYVHPIALALADEFYVNPEDIHIQPIEFWNKQLTHHVMKVEVSHQTYDEKLDKLSETTIQFLTLHELTDIVRQYRWMRKDILRLQNLKEQKHVRY